MLFERSPDYEPIYGLLVLAAPGEIVTFRALHEAVGHPISSSSSPLRSVINRLLNDGIVFANVRLVGYRRLTAEQTVDAADGDRSKLRGHARRNARKLITVDVDFGTLDDRHRIAYAAGLSLFQAIMAATTKRAIQKLEDHVGRTDMRPLPFADTLAAFQK